MKGFTLFCSVLALSAASLAHADFSGTWTGTFFDSGSDGSSGNYQGFSLQLSQSNGMIAFSEPNGYTFLDGMSVSIVGSNLVSDNHVVGSLSADSLDIYLVDDLDGIFDHVQIATNFDGSLSYRDYLADYYGDYIDSTSPMAMCAPQANGIKHAPRGSALRGLFSSLKMKPHAH